MADLTEQEIADLRADIARVNTAVNSLGTYTTDAGSGSLSVSTLRQLLADVTPLIAGTYPDDATGRAAVSDNDYYYVINQPSLMLYQRVDAATSNKIADIPNFFATPLVIVASGQSNMDGAGDGGTTPAETSSVQMFDLTTRAFRDLSYTSRIDRTNVNTGTTMQIPGAAGKNNLAFSFCHAAHEATGRPVYLIIVSNGGTHIGRWVGTDASSIAGFAGPWGPVGTEKPLYVELKAAVEEALVLNGASKIDAFLWHQGETKRPGFESPTDYQTDFETLLSQLESETWWDDNVQVLVGEQIIGSFYQNAENYNDYWRSFNDSGNPFLKAVSAEGLAMNAAISDPDSVHFSGPALYELGRRYWKAYLGDKSVLANRADETTLFGGVSVTYDWKPYKFKAKVILDPLAGRIIENKRIAPTRAGGGFEAGQRVVDQVRCTVTHLTDGTFEVAADNVITLGDWHFTLDDYTQVGPSVTKSAVNDNILTIAGNVDKTLEEKFKIWLDDGDTATLNISYEPYLDADNGNSDDLMEIDWGDGTVDSDLARGTHSHNYSPNYAGYVTVSLPAFCEVTAVISSAGKWRSPVSAFSHLSQMFYFSISGAGSKLYGNLRDLPDAVITCIVQGDSICTWDFTGLPNLKNLTCQGQTDINNPAQFAEMNECTRIILDGKDRTSAQVDDVLIALAEVKTWDGTADIFINYSGQAAPTTASDAAVAELVARGVTVNTN